MPAIFKPDQESIPHIVAILARGGAIVFPTETAYGLGVDATNPEAIEKAFVIKGRPKQNPLSVAVADIAMAKQYGVFSHDAEKIARAFLPGPLTLIVPTNGILPEERAPEKGTVGFRVPDYPWLLDVVRALGKPITATSANGSGKGACYSIDSVRESLGDTWEMLDAVVDAGEIPKTPVSTVVSCMDAEPRILRKGPISGESIKNVLK